MTAVQFLRGDRVEIPTNELEQAKRHLQQASTRLLDPDFSSLDLSAADVAAAVECLTGMEARLVNSGVAGEHELIQEIATLRCALHSTSAMLALLIATASDRTE